MSRKATLGMTDTAYGRSRGTTGAAIRKHRSSGLLRPAILADGSIDAAVADMLLADGLTKGTKPPPTLADARKRKAAAQVALLQDELDGLLEQLVRPEAAAEVTHAATVEIVTAIGGLQDDARHCAGMEVNKAAGGMQDAVIALLTKLSAPPRRRRTKAAKAAAGPSLSEMTAAELAARKADLEARLLEVQRDEAQGVVMRVRDVLEGHGTRLANLRSALLALPTRIAPQLVFSTPSEAATLVRKNLLEMAEDLATDEAQAHLYREIIIG